MKNMFYKYDNDIKDKYCCDCHNYDDQIENSSCDCAEYLYNIKDELVGIKGKANTIFKLYFNFTSNDLENLINTLTDNPIWLDILDFKYELVTTIPVLLDSELLEAEALIDTNSINLVSGIYKLKLWYSDLISGNNYSLFDKKDFILEIE